ncbi:MAG: mechanosensitive ion channel family protein [Verrucomicrobia bacterium]|nr:MAG: mechanosensitive ion channel family protein [Verrucomicrobiota bacterium]
MQIQDTLAKLAAKITGWVEQFILILPNLIIAALVMVVFWFVARHVRRLAEHLFSKVIKAAEVAWLASVVIYLAILIGGLVVALGVVGLDKTVTSLLAGAGIAGLAVALAFQDLGQNILAGIYISLRGTIRTGHIIEVNGHFGTVRKINLRAIHMETNTGQKIVIPNREVFGNSVTIYSTGRRRVDLQVGVSYGDDLEKVRSVTLAAVEAIPARLKNEPAELFYTEFGDSSINFVVRFWIPFKRQRDYRDAVSEAVMRIKRAYDEHGITIPFPIRTLDFGIVGGENLAVSLRRAGLGSAPGADA